MKMNKVLFFISILFVVCSFEGNSQSKKSGNVVKREREVQAFDAIVANGSFELILTQGESTGVIVESDEAAQEFIKTNIDGAALKIDIIESNKKTKVIKIHVTVSDLNSLILLGNVAASSEGVLNCNKLFLFMGGTTSLKINLMASDLDIETGDASNAVLAGSVDVLKVRATDDSDVDAFALESQKCSLKATGFPEVRLNVVSELDLIVTGGGNVYYTGDPVIKSRIFAGSGFVVKRRVETSSKNNENKQNLDPKPQENPNEAEEGQDE